MKLSERLEALAVEAGYEGLDTDKATLLEAAALARRVERAAVGFVDGGRQFGDRSGHVEVCYQRVPEYQLGQRVALVPVEGGA